MKKMILINTVLIILLNTLPNDKLETKETILLTTTMSIEQIDEVTSRSAEPRKEEILNSDNLLPVATTYSENCIKLIKKYEGFKGQAYKLKGEKYWTIGFGHSGADVKEGQVISEEAAERLLIAEVEGIKDYILARGFDFNQNELDAMISFAYNCGIGNFNKITRNRTKSEIAEHIEAYTNGNMKGLVKRRAEEKELFTKEEI